VKILTVPSAKEEIRRLQHFIQVVEAYEADSLEKWVIKEYAYTSSIKEVVNRGNQKGINRNGVPLDHAYVRDIISAHPKDELHRLVRGNYRIRLKSNRNR
jgi:hypothetical protein